EPGAVEAQRLRALHDLPGIRGGRQKDVEVHHVSPGVIRRIVPKAIGKSSPRVAVTRTPSGPQRWMRASGGANSASCCRQRPQGEHGSAPSVTITASTICRSPAATMAPMAVFSAHWVTGKDAFSTLHPA